MTNFKYALAAGVAIISMATAASAQQRSFSVQSQAASRAIPEFARQAGIQIVAPADALAGIVTPAITGQQDVRAALRMLIANTGLEIASDSNGTIVLRRTTPSVSSETTSAADIVVTGSRISGAASTPNPVATVVAEAIVGRSGSVSVGDQLSLLPQFRTTSTQAASTNIGVQAPGLVGVNLLDLRGLEPSRTLVLQNGRRLVSSTQQLSQPDTNTIPVELLERVEILTGGASAVYGADAIAGVVNFVLKDNFEGVSLRGQGGISDRGDAGTQTLGLVAGTNFASGRGNVAVALEYANRDGLRYTDRSFSSGQADFVNNPLAGQAGQPAFVPVKDIRYLAYSDGGTLPYGAPYYRFAANGTLNPANTGAASYPNLGISDGGDGLSPISTGSLLPSNERLAGTILGHFDFSEAATLFGQFDAIRTIASAFGGSSIDQFIVSRSNPYLSTQAQTVLNSYGPTASGAPFVVLRGMSDVGVTGERNIRDTYRGVVGLRGRLSDYLRYETSFSYGETRIDSQFFNNRRVNRVQLAADAVRDTAGVLGTPGAIVCASRLAAPTSTNPDVAKCVPFNIFGAGNVSQAARDYMTVTTRATGKITQAVAGGFLAGDTGGFLTLPGGPASFVVGAEYRRETTSYAGVPLDASQGSTATLQTITPTNGSVAVTEGYAELKLPILSGVPGAERLELSASGRLSHYNLTRIGTKGTWGLGALYQPIRDLTFRASYSRAVRAPNIPELYQPTISGTSQITDPCDRRFIGNGTATRAANCAALGVPTTYQTATIPVTIATTTSGNPNLDVERGTTWTLGVVLEPRFLPQFALTIDYYNIDLKGAIATTNSTIINPFRVPSQCVDAPTIQNPFCALVTRDANSNIVSVSQAPINLTRLETSGVDFDARYRIDLGSEAKLDLRGLVTWVIKRNDYRSPFQPNFATQVVETPSNPRVQVNLATNLTVGSFQLSHRLRWFSSVYYKNDDVAFFESVNGLAPSNPNRRAAGFVKTGAYDYHDLRGSVKFGERSEFYIGVDNLFDKQPAFSIVGAGSVGAQFDSIGRYMYAGFRVGL